MTLAEILELEPLPDVIESTVTGSRFMLMGEGGRAGYRRLNPRLMDEVRDRWMYLDELRGEFVVSEWPIRVHEPVPKPRTFA